MNNVSISLSMSLDGFVAGPNDEIDPLHDWLFNGEHESRFGHGLRMSETSRALLDGVIAGHGACVVGRNTFETANRWGGRPPFDIPYFVVTHDPPTEDRGEFTYVTEGVEAAIEQARAAAGGKDVQIAGGAQAIQQYLAAGHVDEFQLHVAPVFLGSGERLFEGAPAGLEAEIDRVVDSPKVTHLRYRVKR